jgi:hypothetical protein
MKSRSRDNMTLVTKVIYWCLLLNSAAFVVACVSGAIIGKIVQVGIGQLRWYIEGREALYCVALLCAALTLCMARVLATRTILLYQLLTIFLVALACGEVAVSTRALLTNSFQVGISISSLNLAFVNQIPTASAVSVNLVLFFYLWLAYRAFKEAQKLRFP